MRITRLQIGEIASLLGLTIKAIRHYHQLGLLDEPPRGENGYRLYGIEHLERLGHIQRLTRLGLTLKQVGFILSADEPDALLAQLLHDRHDALSEAIARLQAEQARIAAFLQAGVTAEPIDPPPVSAMTVIHAVMRPASQGLADVLVAVESETLARLDAVGWNGDYGGFWEQIAIQLRGELLRDEHAFILWMERYLALAGMSPDDRQAAAWLAELDRGPAVVRRAFQINQTDALTTEEQIQIQRLIALALIDHATPLQRQFLMIALGTL